MRPGRLTALGAVFRGYRGAGLAAVNPNIKSVTWSVHRRGVCRRSGHPSGRHLHPRAKAADRKGSAGRGIIGIQKEAVLAARRAR
jgi:glutaconate CoA-transferase subunit A